MVTLCGLISFPSVKCIHAQHNPGVSNLAENTFISQTSRNSAETRSSYPSQRQDVTHLSIPWYKEKDRIVFCLSKASKIKTLLSADHLVPCDHSTGC